MERCCHPWNGPWFCLTHLMESRPCWSVSIFQDSELFRRPRILDNFAFRQSCCEWSLSFRHKQYKGCRMATLYSIGLGRIQPLWLLPRQKVREHVQTMGNSRRRHSRWLLWLLLWLRLQLWLPIILLICLAYQIHLIASSSFCYIYASLSMTLFSSFYRWSSGSLSSISLSLCTSRNLCSSSLFCCSFTV